MKPRKHSPRRKRPRKAAASETTFRALLEAAQDARIYAESIIATVREPLLILDANLRVKTANRSFYQTFRVSAQETENCLLYDLGNRQWDIPRLRTLLEQILLENTQFQDFEVEHDFPAIGHKVMLLNARRIYREGNRTEMILLAIEDLTERQRREELDRFFTLPFDMLCIAGFDGYFKRLNPAWEKTLGFTNQELLAKPYLEFVHPEDREATAAEAQKLTTGVDTIAFENRYRGKDGSYKWLLWNATPLPGQELIYATARDITARKQDEEALQRAHAGLAASNKELEAFTYSVSHDLRAPLRHIDGFAKILAEEVGPRLDATARHYLQRIQQGTGQMGRLVDDLLNLARLGRQELARQTTGLNSLVEEVLAELKPETEGRQIKWRIGQLPFADCDPALMKQVLSNFLANAVKFTRPREHAVIEVGSTTQNGQPVVFVRDNGIGFSMKYVDKLFGVFQRLHRREDFEGTGVGLATAQRILHKHGGRAWAEAELDKGATFYFSLGLPETPEPDNTSTPAQRGER